MIAQGTIDRVKAHTDLGELIGESVKLQRKHGSLLGLCPFHREKTPSFHVHPDRGFYYCFGCHAKGDAVRFVMEMEGLSFVEAVRRLGERVGIAVEDTGTPEERKQEAEARERERRLLAANRAAALYFQRMLEEHPLRHHAREELRRRDLEPTSPDDAMARALAAFQIGYAPEGFDGLVRELRRVGIDAADAEAAGLLVPRRSGRGHFDRFRHRLTFAVVDLHGRVVAFSGRTLTPPTAREREALQLPPPRESDEQRVAKYVNSPETPVYRKRETVFGLFQARQAIRRAERAILVEGNFDVVSLHARGLDHVVAPLGTALTTAQARQIKRYAPTVVVLFDGDQAGLRATAETRGPCREAQLEARVGRLPAGSDPDDLCRASGVDAVRRIADGAVGLLEFLIERLLDDGFQQASVQGKARRLQRIAELVAEEPDPTVRALAEGHADAIAGRLGATGGKSLRELHRLLSRAARPPTDAPHRHDAMATSPGARGSGASTQLLGEQAVFAQILGVFLDFPELLGTETAMVGRELFGNDSAAAVDALERCHRMGVTDGEQILAELPPAFHSFAASRLAAPRHLRAEDAREELLVNVDKLQRMRQAREVSAAVAQAERALAEGNEEHQLALLRERQVAGSKQAEAYVRRSRQRHGG